MTIKHADQPDQEPKLIKKESALPSTANLISQAWTHYKSRWKILFILGMLLAISGGGWPAPFPENNSGPSHGLTLIAEHNLCPSHNPADIHSKMVPCDESAKMQAAVIELYDRPQQPSIVLQTHLPFIRFTGNFSVLGMWWIIPIPIALLLVFIPIAAILVAIQSFFLLNLIQAISAPDQRSLSEIFSRSKQVYWPFALTMLLYNGLVLAGFVFLIIPGIICLILFSLAPFIAAEQPTTAKKALAASWRLINHHLAAIVWRIIIIWCLAAIAISFSSIFSATFDGQVYPTLWILRILASGVVLPVACIYGYYLYQQVKDTAENRLQ